MIRDHLRLVAAISILVAAKRVSARTHARTHARTLARFLCAEGTARNNALSHGAPLRRIVDGA
jgi:hypothetical protein